MPLGSVFTPDQQKILALVSAGHSVDSAAAAAGIPRDTVRSWLCSSIFCKALTYAQDRRALLLRREAEARLVPLAFETLFQLIADPGTPPRVRFEAVRFALKSRAPLLAHLQMPITMHAQMHNHAQSVSFLPELPAASDSQTEPAGNPAQTAPGPRLVLLRGMHNRAQSVTGLPVPSITYESVEGGACTTPAQPRPRLLEAIKRARD
jgi:hypothetical protein